MTGTTTHLSLLTLSGVESAAAALVGSAPLPTVQPWLVAVVVGCCACAAAASAEVGRAFRDPPGADDHRTLRRLALDRAVTLGLIALMLGLLTFGAAAVIRAGEGPLLALAAVLALFATPLCVVCVEWIHAPRAEARARGVLARLRHPPAPDSVADPAPDRALRRAA
ncbi:MAG: hypothetical protein SFZ24_02010 [Planctomycetota bacterium]|nr:hypothetical protein [Planctomycetota bacterium]